MLCLLCMEVDGKHKDECLHAQNPLTMNWLVSNLYSIKIRNPNEFILLDTTPPFKDLGMPDE